MKTTLSSTENSFRRVTASEVHKNRNHALLLDVCTSAEFEESHIDGSLSHPLSNLEVEKIKQLAEGKEACVLICRSGGRARKAAKKLQAGGLTNLCVLEGGLQAWIAEDLPVNKGKQTMSLERQVRIAAGTLVLTGALLALIFHPAWIILSGFVGAGLIFAGITNTCGMGMLIARMPWNTKVQSCHVRTR